MCLDLGNAQHVPVTNVAPTPTSAYGVAHIRKGHASNDGTTDQRNINGPAKSNACFAAEEVIAEVGNPPPALAKDPDANPQCMPPRKLATTAPYLACASALVSSGNTDEGTYSPNTDANGVARAMNGIAPATPSTRGTRMN